MSIRLMLADDHRMLREGLRRSMTDAGFDVVGEAGDGVEAIAMADDLQPDVILMDVTMPNCDGVEACRRVIESGSDTRVVMLTMHADQEVLANAIRAGAIGYLTKDSSTREIADAVRMAVEGDTVLSPQLARTMLEEVRKLDAPGTHEAERVISDREVEVLRYVGKGYAKKQIAEMLGISVKTVDKHVTSVMEKLDIHDRVELALYAVREKFISA